MKATGIVRRIDDLGRVVIPKEIRRTMRIREGDLLRTTWTPIDKFCIAIHSVVERYTAQQKFYCAVDDLVAIFATVIFFIHNHQLNIIVYFNHIV